MVLNVNMCVCMCVGRVYAHCVIQVYFGTIYFASVNLLIHIFHRLDIKLTDSQLFILPYLSTPAGSCQHLLALCWCWQTIFSTIFYLLNLLGSLLGTMYAQDVLKTMEYSSPQDITSA